MPPALTICHPPLKLVVLAIPPSEIICDPRTIVVLLAIPPEEIICHGLLPFIVPVSIVNEVLFAIPPS